MSRSYDAIVVGVGTMGAAACMVLARRGVRVLGIDRFSPPHDRGSHHGRSRIFRAAYYEHPDYVPLLQRAHDLWKDIERRSGESLFAETGVLYMGAADAPLIRDSAASARRHGVEHEVLPHTELRRRFPQFVMPGAFVGLHEPHAGMVFPEAAVGAMIREAESHGAQIARGETVRSWAASGAGVEVRTDLRTVSTGRVILTAGPWAPGLLHNLGVALTPTRQPVGWFLPRSGAEFAAAGPGRPGFPCWAIGHDDGTLHYGFPLAGGESGLKVAHHAIGPAADPDRLDRDVRPGDEADIRRILTAHIPAADGPLYEIQVCMYTNSPDGHFIIDRAPGQPSVIVATGFSGHGFKFAPVIGEALADLAMTGRTDLPVGFLGLARFGVAGS